MTPLQARMVALFAVLAAAREELDDQAYAAFVAIATELVMREGARLAVGEALRAVREAA